MRSESELVNSIYENLCTVHPDAIVHTVFDAFIVEKKYLETLRKLIEAKGKDYLGFLPKYKVDGDIREGKSFIQINDNGIDITKMPAIAEYGDYFSRVTSI